MLANVQAPVNDDVTLLLGQAADAMCIAEAMKIAEP
jgi:hypothetical protein